MRPSVGPQPLPSGLRPSGSRHRRLDDSTQQQHNNTTHTWHIDIGHRGRGRGTGVGHRGRGTVPLHTVQYYSSTVVEQRLSSRSVSRATQSRERIYLFPFYPFGSRCGRSVDRTPTHPTKRDRHNTYTIHTCMYVCIHTNRAIYNILYTIPFPSLLVSQSFAVFITLRSSTGFQYDRSSMRPVRVGLRPFGSRPRASSTRQWMQCIHCMVYIRRPLLSTRANE